MYTLRIIEETRENEKDPFEQVIKNFELGNFYQIARRGCTSKFDDLLNEQPEHLRNRTDVHCWIGLWWKRQYPY